MAERVCGCCLPKVAVRPVMTRWYMILARGTRDGPISLNTTASWLAVLGDRGRKGGSETRKGECEGV